MKHLCLQSAATKAIFEGWIERSFKLEMQREGLGPKRREDARNRLRPHVTLLRYLDMAKHENDRRKGATKIVKEHAALETLLAWFFVMNG